jgi:serine protease Do
MRSALRLTLATLLVGCSQAPDESAAQRIPPATSSTSAATSARLSEGRRTAITTAAEAIAPSVVTVQTTRVQQVQGDIFSMFFGGAQPGTRVLPGLGTGFIVKSDGVIVTNAHVVTGADSISVMMRDGTVYPATLRGTDETNDLAVIKIDANNLPVAKLGNSRSLMVGEWAIAIGNPYGFVLGNSEPSVTAGVISGVGRNLVGAGRGDGQALYFDMIQTDASINPGNSGGPLVNADGEVIGVNSSIYSNTGESVGVGFAIPINRAARVVDDLLDHGAVRRPWIGVHLERPRATSAREVIARGATIAAVIDGSPAQRGGLRAGDVIVRAADRAIRNPFDWDAAQLDLSVGQTAAVVVSRGGREVSLQVQVADLPEATAPKVQVLTGLELTTLTPVLRADRGILSPNGALITRVDPTVGRQLGIQAGDVIFGVNNREVANANAIKQAIEQSGRGGIRLHVERNGQRFYTDFAVR